MADVDDLWLLCMQMQREQQMIRELLEQWLEVREDVMEVAQHRDALLECLELRAGMQVLFHSAQAIREMDDRASELELSLAGVSDNIARHGKALSSLTEHQQSTSLTINAIVGAVKRLDRSRARAQVNAGHIVDAGSDFSSQGAFGSHVAGMLDERVAFADSNFIDDWLEGFDLSTDVVDLDKPRIIGGSSTCRSNDGLWRLQKTERPQCSISRGSVDRRRADDGHTSAQPGMENRVRGICGRIDKALHKLDTIFEPARRVEVGGNRRSGSGSGVATVMSGEVATRRSAISHSNCRGASSDHAPYTSRSAGHVVPGAVGAPPHRHGNNGPPSASSWLEASRGM